MNEEIKSEPKIEATPNTVLSSDVQEANKIVNEKIDPIEANAPEAMKLSGVVEKKVEPESSAATNEKPSTLPEASPKNQIAPVSVNDDGKTSARTSPSADVPADVQVKESDSANNQSVNSDENVESDTSIQEQEEQVEQVYAEPLVHPKHLERYETNVQEQIKAANELLKTVPGRMRIM